jgi:hypothetical protein
MGLDIRLPIGLLFLILGGLLVLYGLISGDEIYRRSLDVNVNLWWGLVLLVFGALMAFAGRRRPAPPPSGEAPAHPGPGVHH